MLTLLITLLLAITANACAADRVAAVETTVQKVVDGMSTATNSFKTQKEHYQEAVNEARANSLSITSETAGFDACDKKYSGTGEGWKRQGCKLYVSTKWSLCNPNLPETSVGGGVIGACTEEERRLIEGSFKTQIEAMSEADPYHRSIKEKFVNGIAAAKNMVLPTENKEQRLAHCDSLGSENEKKGCRRYLDATWDICHPAAQAEAMVAFSNETATKTGALLIFAGLLASFWFCSMSSKKNFYKVLSEDASEL